MRDGAIEEIYHLVEAALRAGQQEVQVHAFPFRLSQAQLAARAHHPCAGEWAGLKEGYDLFEATRVPPRIAVCGGRYAVGPSAGDCTAITAW
jgi:murein L,D-transpeptidase YafK